MFENQANGNGRHELAELACRALLFEQLRQLAHQMRSPLNVVDLMCETLQLDVREDTETQERLRQLSIASARISGALSESLREACFSTGVPRPTAIFALLGEVLHAYGARTDPFADHTALVLADPAALRAALVHSVCLLGGDGAVLDVDGARGDDEISLRLTLSDTVPDGNCGAFTSFDRALMIQVIERTARECGGSVAIEPRTLSFRLPAYLIQEPA